MASSDQTAGQFVRTRATYMVPGVEVLVQICDAQCFFHSCISAGNRYRLDEGCESLSQYTPFQRIQHDPTAGIT